MFQDRKRRKEYEQANRELTYKLLKAALSDHDNEVRVVNSTRFHTEQANKEQAKYQEDKVFLVDEWDADLGVYSTKELVANGVKFTSHGVMFYKTFHNGEGQTLVKYIPVGYYTNVQFGSPLVTAINGTLGTVELGTTDNETYGRHHKEPGTVS